MFHVVDLAEDALVDLNLTDILIDMSLILHLGIFITAVLFEKLVHDLISCLWVLRKLDEKEGHAWIVEESFLGFLAVLIHGLSYYLEVYLGSLNNRRDILLLKVVAEHDSKDTGCPLQEQLGTKLGVCFDVEQFP